MTTTPRLAITELVSGQAVPESSVNEGLLILEFFANACHFKSRATTAEPGSPAEGDCYLLPASPTGTHWSGNGGKIALFYNGAWTFKAVKEGFLAWIDDEGILIASPDGSTWSAIGTAAESSNAQMWAGTDTASRVTPRRIATSAAPQTLTDGATTNWDMSQGFNAKWTLGGNRTLATPTNPIQGWTYSLNVIQDGTGTRTVTWPVSFDWGTAGAPTLTTTASKRDRITLFCTDAATPKFDAFLSGKGFS